MEERLKMMEARYQEIGKMLESPEVASDVKRLTVLMKEMRSLEKPVNLYHEYKDVLNQIDELEILKNENDLEIRELALADLEEKKARKQELEDEIKILLIPKDPNDEKNVIMEIRGAAGGDEANIFAGDLFRMYSKYAESKGWKIEITNALPADLGGFSQIEYIVKGENAYSFLKYESGAHRVQRVPETETAGRIHTSTATSSVLHTWQIRSRSRKSLTPSKKNEEKVITPSYRRVLLQKESSDSSDNSPAQKQHWRKRWRP